jgi:hypothetical protein
MELLHSLPWRRRAAPAWLKVYAQIGIGTLSFLYLAMGALTAMAALGLGGEKADHKDVLPFLLVQPFGRGLVLAALAGLVGYITWRLYLAVIDPDHREAGPRTLILRAGYLVSACFHGGLAWYAVHLLILDGRVAQDDQTVTVADLLLRQPMGPWWVGLLAATFASMGLFQFWKVWSDRYLRRIRDPELIRRHDTLVRWSGTVGFSARGVVFLIIAYLFLRAGMYFRPAEAGGTEKAMTFLESVPFGEGLLALLAFGLMAYGVFLGIQAWSLQDDLGG